MQYQRSIALLLLFLLTQVSIAWAQAPTKNSSAPVQYLIGTNKLDNHTLEITATYPPAYLKGGELTLTLPVWTPGSYKVRDYSRFLNQLKVLGANSGAKIEKNRKNRWTLTGLKANEAVTVSYEVYGRELTVRTNYFTRDLGLLIGAATFVAPPSPEGPLIVSFADQSLKVSTGLPKGPDQTSYIAQSYDQLLDCPILFGNIDVHPFTAGDTQHWLVQAGDRRFWDTQQSLEDLKKIVEVQQDFWGTTPYKNYTFMNLVTNTRGGLEHKNSTVMMTSRFATQVRDKYVDWLSLASHEFFHTWNVKRLRPKALGPFDYENEVYTKSLWVAEGITTYYDDLLVRRAGLSTRAEYLKKLSKGLNRLAGTPGRRNIPLTQASQDAWIRLYLDSEHNLNTNISYYNKGSVVAWLLDTEIRRATKGRKSLDDVMRQAYSEFSKNGFREEEFRTLVSDVAGRDLTPFFQRALDSTQDLPLQEALDYWGLDWKIKDKDSSPYLGVMTKTENDRAFIKNVLAGSPAAKAGLAPGDELLSFHNLRVPAEGPADILKHLDTDQAYEVLVARLGRIQSLKVHLSKHPHPTRELKARANFKDQNTLWADWLGPDSKGES